MLRLASLVILVLGSLASSVIAQLANPSTATKPQFQGLVKNPEFFSAMTALFQGNLNYVEKMDLKGRVAEVEREEISSVVQSPYPFHHTVKIKFDEEQHAVERVDEERGGIRTVTSEYRDGRIMSQTVNHGSKIPKRLDSQDWRRWIYDSSGRISDFRAGTDKEEWNHYLNFEYDEKKRLIGCEYRQQGSDKLFSSTKIKYGDNTIVTDEFDAQGHNFFQQVQILDESGRVVDLKVSDLSKGVLTLWYHVKFKYDDHGRVVEQKTDYPPKLGEGDDDIPAPGRLVSVYDDEKRTLTREFFEVDGKLGFRTIAELDRDGVPTKLGLFDSSGKEKPGGESFMNPQTKKIEARAGTIAWEISYDDHGNWTERKRWFTPADGSERVMTRSIRQTIKYRE